MFTVKGITQPISSVGTQPTATNDQRATQRAASVTPPQRAQSLEQRAIDSAKAAVQKELNSKIWIGGTIPTVIDATVLDQFSNFAKTVMNVEVRIDMNPLMPGSNIKTQSYVAIFDTTNDNVARPM